MKKGIKQIFTILCIILVINSSCSSTFARITDVGKDGTMQALEIEDPNEPGVMLSVLDFTISLAESDLGKELIVKNVTKLARWFVTTFMQIVGSLFAKVGIGSSTSLYYPMPDHIIFNLVPFFDPNFIDPYNPAKLNPGQVNYIFILSKVIAPLYYSGVLLVTAIFGTFALLIGVKLVISVSAQQKAQYKTAIMTWITGIVLLYAGHFIMAGVFYLNEQVVSGIYKATNSRTVLFQIPISKYDDKDFIEESEMHEGVPSNSNIPFIVTDEIDGVKEERVYILGHGFEGLFNMYYAKACSNDPDMVSTIIIGLLAGQGLALTVLYIKRLFFCILLGLLYPFVVAFDTYKKILGKNGGIFEKWLAQFISTVFIQSIQAIILYFVFMFMVGLVKTSLGVADVEGNIVLNIFSGAKKTENQATAYLVALTQMIVLGSFTKLEKAVKGITGFQDGQVGDTTTSARQAISGYAAAKIAYGNIKDNFTGVRDGVRNVRSLKKKIRNLTEPESKDKAKDATEKTDTQNNGEQNNGQMTPITGAVSPAGSLKEATARSAANGLAGRGNDMQQLAFAVSALAHATGTANPALNRINESLSKLEVAMQNGNTKIGNVNKEPNVSKENDKKQSLEDLKTELGKEKRNLLGKTVAATSSLSIVMASSAIGGGMGSGKLTSALISAGDYIAEAIGRAAAQSGVQEPIINTMVKVDEFKDYYQSTTLVEKGQNFRDKVVEKSKNLNPKGGKGAEVSENDKNKDFDETIN